VVPAAAAIIIGAAFTTSTVANAAPISARSAATPDRPSSCIKAGQTFKVTKKNTTDLGDGAHGAWNWAHNRTSGQAMLAVQLATNSQVTYSISATVGVEAGVIFASASASVTGGISYSHTDTINHTFTIPVAAHSFGVIGLDNVYWRFWGTYTFHYLNCKPSSYKGVFAEFPSKAPQGLEGADIHYAPTRPPWPLAPRR
jgi:hypothetical protein